MRGRTGEPSGFGGCRKISWRGTTVPIQAATRPLPLSAPVTSTTLPATDQLSFRVIVLPPACLVRSVARGRGGAQRMNAVSATKIKPLENKG